MRGGSGERMKSSHHRVLKLYMSSSCLSGDRLKSRLYPTLVGRTMLVSLRNVQSVGVVNGWQSKRSVIDPLEATPKQTIGLEYIGVDPRRE